MAIAPVVSLDALCAPGAVLVAAPHPDDESLGCGGLIALAAAEGRKVVVAVLTDGAASHPGSRRFPPPALAALREAEVRKAAAWLGKSVEVSWLGAADGDLVAQEAEAAAWLLDLCDRHHAGTLLTTWEADPHPDHKAAFRIAEHAAFGLGRRLLAYPIWGLSLPNEVVVGSVAPCLRLDVSAVLGRKARAIAAHRSQTTGLIDDDPNGFYLHADDLARHAQAHEAYLRIR